VGFDVPEAAQYDRRRFLRTGALTIAAARLGIISRLRSAGASASLAGALAEAGSVHANQRVPRELAAIVNAPEWLNSPRLTASSLAGKVVLVDFWTYTCINWLRTLPYVRAWAHKYQQGVVVIGVHTPEFPFERNVDNVRRSVQQMRIEYPVVIDNDYAIWRAFNNEYWPALYLVDGRGRVRHRQFGEGEYEASERAVQRLLKETGAPGVSDGVVSVDGSGFEAAADWSSLRSPETYVGYDRTQNFASQDAARLDQRRTYRAPSRLALNQWSLAGDWTMGKAAAVLNKASGQILHRFHARDVHLVMGPSRSESPVPFRVTIDGQPLGAARGLDVDEGGKGTVREQRLYSLVRQPKPIVDRTFAIDFADAGVEAFAFTFG
jgi:thiol-disulfide isomerase/thioredoxin